MVKLLKRDFVINLSQSPPWINHLNWDIKLDLGWNPSIDFLLTSFTVLDDGMGR